MKQKSRTGHLSVEDFEPDVLAVARRFTRAGMDSCAQDVDDYASALRVAVWKALNTEAKYPRAYVKQAIWNTARRLYQQAARYQGYLRQLQHAGLSGSYDPYDQLDARLDLQKVMVDAPEAFKELVLVIDEGTISALRGQGGCSRTTLHRRHHRNVQCAQEALKKGTR
jgi:hypothetical protein